jgi:hypothetical protein
MPGYMDPALAALQRRSPSLAARVRVHETGAPPPRLDGVCGVVFWLADPLRERFPDCHAEAEALAGAARERGIALVNPPESLSRSIKSRQARLWRDAGIDTPPCLRFDDAEQLRARAREIGFPLLIRSDEEHSQAGMRVVRDERELDARAASRLRLPGAVSPLWDTRESHRSRDPDGIYASLHHKKRLYVLGDRVRTEHVFFAREPIVSSETCGFRRLHEQPAWRRGISLLVEQERLAIREDIAYWRRGEAHAELMLRAAAALGFGFAAIDYSDRADGTAMLWEANPYPYLPSLEAMRLPRQRLGRERIASYERAVGDFLVRLMGAEPD